jgi:hypothetical protein
LLASVLAIKLAEVLPAAGYSIFLGEKVPPTWTQTATQFAARRRSSITDEMRRRI